MTSLRPDLLQILAKVIEVSVFSCYSQNEASTP